MMIAQDNWKWMPVRQAARLTERRDDTKVKDRRILARTQFGKRLLLLPCVEASEIIPPEEDDDDGYTERGVSRDPTATTRALDQEEKEEAQWIERRAHEFCEQAEVHRQRAENRRRSGAWRSRPREIGQQEAGEGQDHPGGGDCHADRFAGRLSRGGRLSGLRLQQFQQSCGHVLLAGPGTLP